MHCVNKKLLKLLLLIAFIYQAPCHFMQSHIRKVYTCLSVTYHLHFWQNDRDLLRATAVTLGWNGYRNNSQHRKLTLEKKILPPLQQGFEPATFRSRVRRSNHWAIPLPIAAIISSGSFSPNKSSVRSRGGVSLAEGRTWGWWAHDRRHSTHALVCLVFLKNQKRFCVKILYYRLCNEYV